MSHQSLTGQLFDEAIAVLNAQGFVVRYEHLGGNGTGFCQLGQQSLMIIDVAQPVDEQLQQLTNAVASQPLPDAVEPSAKLRALIDQVTEAK